ncbi:hypothetical protein [Bacteroides caecicola]|uniref:hypothetical protein n=1 Tax=Bacteroidaceae TaxID=815 RepID=UPI0020133C93|nr:hypothetical protein [Bacteroides caecicola]MCL1626136.1 hypothetical protein [Bacteroides caecicola]
MATILFFINLFYKTAAKIVFNRTRESERKEIFILKQFRAYFNSFPACPEAEKTLTVEMVNAMGRNGQHIRMGWITLTVAFYGI